MGLQKLLTVLAAVPLLVDTKPIFFTSLDAETHNATEGHGIEQPVPGVVGARVHKLFNNGILEDKVVSRLNQRLKNRVNNTVAPQKSRIKSWVNRILARNTDAEDPTNSFTKLDASTPCYVETMQNRLTYYLLNITLGNPAQQFMVQVDTGSSDLWVPSRIIQYNGFDSRSSKSFRHLSDDFSIKYVKDSAQGFWGVDDLAFGGSNVKVPNFQFGVATTAPDATMGILGIGPVDSEVSKTSYPNLPRMMVHEGLISRSVYSMYMGGVSNNEGTILFGGVDKAKYKQLSTIPIKSKSTITVELDIVAMTTSKGPKSRASTKKSKRSAGPADDPEDHAEVERSTLEDLFENETEFDIFDSPHGYFADETLSAVKTNSEDMIISQQPLNVLLDTGTSLTYLPSSLVQAIAAEFRATFESDVGMYVVHEDQINNSPLQGINFQFQNQVIFMPKSELFWPLSWFSLSPSPYYAMTILASDNSMNYNILGDSFLRNAYVVYDLDHEQVHIGQYYPSSSNHIVSL